ncbi:hypothetical protein B0H14DRAFT_3082751 [Mycena olivaceomarginata]|nr:hypothetical protein B0H14DRAFT_3082751 [Mycena olivaceomarginata]
MSLIKPSGRKGPVSGKNAGRRNNNNQIYAHPLPVVFWYPPPTRIRSLLGLLGLTLTKVETPQCHGIFDEATRSVWVESRDDSTILWRRGFFGKGDLSRSEPSWLARQINARRTGGSRLTSEEMTAKRRAERKQFKIDRARAIAAVAAEAEAVFESEGRVVDEAPPEEDEEPPEDLEHLQLTLPEAFFLMWNLNCLTVTDPLTNELMTTSQIWLAFQTAHLKPPTLRLPAPSRGAAARQPLHHQLHRVPPLPLPRLGRPRRDQVLRGLHAVQAGPVFNHAEFSVVVCPPPRSTLHHASPFAWSWLSTINRVNTQVPSSSPTSPFPARARLPAADPAALTQLLSSPACLQHYSVREVTVRRFIPARMRD